MIETEIFASNLKHGEEFIYSGRKFIALGFEQGGILAVAKEPIKKQFDKDGSNNWRISSLRKYLNGDFLENELNVSALIPFASDLTADDGQKEYGQSMDLVFLLSADLYRKYRYCMPKWSTWVWLVTPCSCLTSNNVFDDFNFVRGVNTDGSLCDSYAVSSSGVAVACLINPKSSVIKIGERQHFCPYCRAKIDT